jgi:hypothetical protein
MNVKITKADAEAFILDSFQRCGVAVTSMTIELPPPPAISGNYVEAICRVKMEFPGYRSEQKIAAIKRLRELVPGLGLGDAKVAIENVESAIVCYLSTGQIFTYGVNAR